MRHHKDDPEALACTRRAEALDPLGLLFDAPPEPPVPAKESSANRTATFGGTTFDQKQDRHRLVGALKIVLNCLRSGGWWTAAELSRASGCNESAAGSRARDLRKAECGKHNVRCVRVSLGLWMYGMVGAPGVSMTNTPTQRVA